MIKKPTIVDARESSAQMLSKAALQAMAEVMLDPTPENYEVWYSHVSGENADLSKDIATLKKQNIEFSEAVMEKLAIKHMEKKSPTEEASDGVSDAMTKLMRMMGDFSTDAATYNDKLGEQTDNISSKIEGDTAMQELLGEVMGQLKEVQQNGADFSQKMRESQREITELRQNLEKATSEARIDGLTGINNRRAFDELIEQQASIAEAEKNDLCLLMLDIDHFKSFNDTHGHQIGDEVIKIVAGALKRTVRGQDIVARYGGEEFAVLLPETPTNGAHIVAENIRKLIASNRLKRKNGKGDLGQITISIGVTRYHVGDDEESVEYFIKRADNALYSAKENGRNRVSLEL